MTLKIGFFILLFGLITISATLTGPEGTQNDYILFCLHDGYNLDQ